MSGCLIALIVFLGLLVVGGLAAGLIGGLLRAGDGQTGGLMPGDRIGLITISGIIESGDDPPSLFGGIPSGEIQITRQLRQAAKDASIKAVLLRINSPGGSAAASQAIYREVMRLREKKPVVASMGDVAASGGYYIAAAANVIVAGPATMTGSIGVITEVLNYGDLARRFGVKEETLTSGPYKDTMNPMRPMRPDERQLLKAMIDEIYAQFVADVAAGRKMKVEQVRKLADGRVYTGTQAKKVGLVDELGNFRDALELAARKAGIKGEPRVRQLGRTGGLAWWLGESTDDTRLTALVHLAEQARRSLGPGLWMLMSVDQTVRAR